MAYLHKNQPLFNKSFHEFLTALGVDPTGKLTTSFDTVVRIEIPAKATTVACPTVADPKPKGNKPKFGCSFATIGSSETDNITIHYKGIDIDGDVAGSELFTTTQAIGRLTSIETLTFEYFETIFMSWINI